MDSVETIDMGEFSLDLDQGKNQSSQGKELENYLKEPRTTLQVLRISCNIWKFCKHEY